MRVQKLDFASAVWSFRAIVLQNTICSKEKVLFTFNPFDQYGFFSKLANGSK